ncbi:MAG TPA: TetR/AcrR family transcriptional regulator [Thermodesulfobacteriota bacterium]|nr:TetR/AcrR family transcriptional regulator [Thermodesulfobacteriota bacterium]
MTRKGTLLEEKKEWTRKAIIKAAKKVFLERGYFNTTIEKVAAEARVSKGAIYLYFPGKDDLFMSLLVPMMQDLGRRLQVLEEKVSNDSYLTGAEVVMGFYESFKGIYEADPDIFSIMRAFQIGALTMKMNEQTAAEINRYARTNSKIGRSIIAKAIELKLLREVDPALLYNMLWGIFIGIVQLEESKFRATQKNHILSTLEYAFRSLIDHLTAVGK